MKLSKRLLNQSKLSPLGFLQTCEKHLPMLISIPFPVHWRKIQWVVH